MSKDRAEEGVTDVAVGLSSLHQAIAGLVEEALRGLPVLGWGRVEEVEETFLVGLALLGALPVTLHEEVHVEQVAVLDWTFLRSCSNGSRLGQREKTKNCKDQLSHFL